jgi:hypothetical protein
MIGMFKLAASLGTEKPRMKQVNGQEREYKEKALESRKERKEISKNEEEFDFDEDDFERF